MLEVLGLVDSLNLCIDSMRWTHVLTDDDSLKPMHSYDSFQCMSWVEKKKLIWISPHAIHRLTEGHGETWQVYARLLCSTCRGAATATRQAARTRTLLYLWYNRRKFRTQTSDNMDRWKSRGGKSQRGEEQKREDQRRERVRRKKMQVREKVGKSRFTVFSNDLWLRRVEK